MSRHARVRVKEVIAMLRQRILEGPWNPGARIPTKLEIAKDLHASDGTVQKALKKLKKQGFLESHGRLGTWVRQRPPQLRRIGLVAIVPCEGIWMTTLRTVAERSASDGHHKLRCYFDCRRTGTVSSPSLQQLESDVADSQLDGLILVAPFDALAGTQAMTLPGLARARIGQYMPGQCWPTIELRPTYPRAMQRLQQLGRRRLAIITTFHHANANIEPILQCAREHGLQTHHAWIHYVFEQTHETARSIADLLMQLPPQKRPDAIYIGDDHLVTSVTYGLAGSRVRVPEELTIIAHANFPTISPTALPVTYLGYDHESILQTAVGLVNRQLDGQRVSDLIQFDPIFDSELSAKS